jgi:hypothetical protein
MLNDLILGAILTALYYLYNTNTDQYLDNTQYLLAFAAFTLAVLLYKKFIAPKLGKEVPDVVEMMGLQKLESSVASMVNGDNSNGAPEAPCYNVPYHVVSTQYGDKALLAGYNEAVQPYDTGAAGLFEPPFRAGAKECQQIDYDTDAI